MHHRIVVAAMASVLSLSTAGSVQAAPLNPFHHASGDKAAASKMISFHIRNDSQAQLVLKSGEQQISIAPGKTATMSLPDGAEIVNVSGTTKQPAGSVLTKVDRALQGNTLAVS